MAILLLLETPPPGSTPDVVVPDVVVNYLWRRESGDTSDGIRLATVIPDGSYTDWTVAHRQGYQYRAQAVGTNGTTTFSAWT